MWYDIYIRRTFAVRRTLCRRTSTTTTRVALWNFISIDENLFIAGAKSLSRRNEIYSAIFTTHNYLGIQSPYRRFNQRF